MDSFEHLGYFWVPDDPERKQPGKLSFDPVTGGKLELYGNLEHSANRPAVFNPGRTIDIILGEVFQSLVTLRNCLVNYAEASWGPTTASQSTVLRIGCIFLGEHFASSDKLTFRELTVGFTYLNAWIGRSGIERKWDRISNGHYEITYDRPEPVDIEHNGLKLSIYAAWVSTGAANEAGIRANYRISLTPDESLHIDKYREIVDDHLRSFLSLATGRTVFPVDLRIWQTKDVRIFYRMRGYETEDESVSPWPMLFTFSDIESQLRKYMANWIDMNYRLRSVMWQFYWIQYQPVLHLETSFLLLAQALEGFHRIVCGGVYQNDKEYEPVKQALIAAIPDSVSGSHRDKLKAMIKYGFEYSFRKRLETICGRYLENCSEVVEDLLGDRRQFALGITKIRNTLTHPDVRRSVDELENDDLFYNIRRMQMLMRICFLKEMGFPPGEITRLLNKNQEYQVLTKDNSD